MLKVIILFNRDNIDLSALVEYQFCNRAEVLRILDVLSKFGVIATYKEDINDDIIDIDIDKLF